MMDNLKYDAVLISLYKKLLDIEIFLTALSKLSIQHVLTKKRENYF